MTVTEKVKEAVGLGHDDHGAPKGRKSPAKVIDSLQTGRLLRLEADNGFELILKNF